MLVFKFIEHPLNNEKPQKTGVKFKITSLKVKGPIDYVPEMVSISSSIQAYICFNFFWVDSFCLPCLVHNKNKLCCICLAFLFIYQPLLFWIVGVCSSCKQFDELKDQVTVEQILQVVFLDPERSCPVSAEFLSFHLYLVAIFLHVNCYFFACSYVYSLLLVTTLLVVSPTKM